MNGFTDHSEVQIFTSAIANPRNLQIITAPAKPFSDLLCLYHPFLATATNSGDSSPSRAQVVSSQPPVQNSALNWLTTNLVAPSFFLCTDRVENTFSSSNSIVAEACLPCRCTETGCITPLFIRHFIATAVHATVSLSLPPGRAYCNYYHQKLCSQCWGHNPNVTSTYMRLIQ
jgi:hypothetical protein